MAIVRLTPDLVGPEGFRAPAAPEDDEIAARDPAFADALERMQARDDSLFVSTALAGLMARQGAALDAARAAAFADPDPLGRSAEGLARTLHEGFTADVETVAANAAALAGPRPSDAALELFRRRAESLRAGLGARAAVVEDAARKAGQLRGIEDGIGGLEALLRSDPDGLDDALARLDDMARASVGLIGEELAATLQRDSAARLAEASAAGLIARNPDEAIMRLAGGEFDEHLDTGARDRLKQRAETHTAALAEDEAASARRAEAEAVRATDAASVAFARDFLRAIDAGEASRAQLAEALSSGTVTPAQAASLREAMAAAEAAREAELAQIARVRDALAAGKRLNPASDDDRAAAWAHFREVSEEASGVDPETRIAAVEDYAALTGIAPEEAARRIGGDLLFGAPEIRLRAAQAVALLIQTDPHLRSLYPPELIALAERLEALKSFGVPADQATALVDDGAGADVDGAGGEEPGDAVRVASRARALKALLHRLLGRGRSPQPGEKPPEPDRGVPLPPFFGNRDREEVEEPPQDGTPGIGHNGPPEEAPLLDNTDDAGEVVENELRPGIKVRGNPNSDLWKRFTDALSLIPSERSRKSAERIVNGGTLTTSEDAGPELSNITRKGGMKESLQAWKHAVVDAGGDPKEAVLRRRGNLEIRQYTAEDGTEFLHLTESKSGPPTVYVQIKPLGKGTPKTGEIKIRFEE